jgi:hypothetical protein
VRPSLDQSDLVVLAFALFVDFVVGRVVVDPAGFFLPSEGADAVLSEAGGPNDNPLELAFFIEAPVDDLIGRVTDQVSVA